MVGHPAAFCRLVRLPALGLWFAIAAILLGCGDDESSAAAGHASFQLLRGLPGESVAYAVSADGTSVAGVAEDLGHAFRWNAGGGMASLGDLPGKTSSTALAISADGRTVTGFSGPVNAGAPFLWTAGSGLIGLNPLPDSERVGSATGVSANGDRIVGWTLGPNRGATAVVWDSRGEPLQIAPDTIASYAVGLTPDGAVVVGNSFLDSQSEPFRWEDTTGPVLLGDAPRGTGRTVANAISADGRRICGVTRLDTGQEAACCWSAAAGWRILPGRPGTNSTATAVSGNGTVVVGAVDGEAAVWIGDELFFVVERLRRFGIDLPANEWQVWSANAVTRDGQTLVGSAVAPDGLEAAWIATLPQSAK